MGETSFGGMSTSQSARRIDRARRPSFGARVVRVAHDIAMETRADWARALRRRRHARNGRRFYSQFVGRRSLCFDVGANVGTRVEIFLSLGATVVAVEPQPACVARLKLFEDPRLIIEEIGLGASAGRAEMHIADQDVLSSMAPEWIERVRTSGRFAARQWDQTISVRVDTLDAMIARHGVPSFCKIDVEGDEREVLAGLSQPLPAVSFECTPEYAEVALRCVDHLRSLGMTRFNFSAGETWHLIWDRWRPFESIVALLDGLPRDGRFFGDVYATTQRV